MRFLKYLTFALFLLPISASAQSVPAFPMAFWGNVTLNGSPAPVGTIVNAYYGSTLAGSVTVQEIGIYGYTEPTKQKLIVGAGSSTITFKVQSSGFNSGVETSGDASITFPGFISSDTEEKDLAFTLAAPTPSPAPIPPPAPSGGGGGRGGGGGFFFTSPPAPATTTATTTAISISTSTPTMPPLTPPAPQGQVLGASAYNFTRLLKRGMSGDDVLELQKLLISLGFLTVDAPTNYFGALTEAAVKAYQKANGLDQVGYLGPKTRALLNTGNTPSANPNQALIDALMAQVQVLLHKIAALKAQATSTPL